MRKNLSRMLTLQKAKSSPPFTTVPAVAKSKPRSNHQINNSARSWNKPTLEAEHSPTARRLQKDPPWEDLILFYEYFHGDNGRGVGTSHQTGWTGVVAKLLQQLL